MTPLTAPPLRAAVTAVLTVCIILAAVTSPVGSVRSRMAAELHKHESELGRLDTERGAKEPPVKVVALGTSLLLFAAHNGKKMEETARDDSGLSLRFAKIIEPSGGLGDWTPLMEKIMEAKPDILLMESNYFFYRLIPWNLYVEAFFKEYQKHFRETILFIGGEDRLLNNAFATRLLRLRDKASIRMPRGLAETQEEVALLREERLAFGLRPGYEEILKRFREKRISVIMLDIPMHEKGKVTRSESQLNYMNETMAKMEAGGLISLLAGFTDLDENDYVDFRHMNPSGREKFSRWLIAALKEAKKP